ncbi:lipocalin-like domain-containing protein [Mesorhizobium sp.]|uniref:lipocalin-like domain-containing protein n=1 Tax=Mesorhizobium sp. TaxID=1871066 RepID=UPI0025E047EB|nr:lipocalin-like domain-containing protein [Mesorhizobium sp.]
MMTTLKFAALALALAVSTPALSQDNKASIVGAWRMTSLQFTNSEGNLAEVPYLGQVIFSQGGTLSVQAMDPDPAAKPTTYTANGYEAYYGPVEIDEAKSTFTITVESSLVRDLIGQKLVRKFEVTGDQLVILPADPKEGWRVTYDRF